MNDVCAVQHFEVITPAYRNKLHYLDARYKLHHSWISVHNERHLAEEEFLLMKKEF